MLKRTGNNHSEILDKMAQDAAQAPVAQPVGQAPAQQSQQASQPQWSHSSRDMVISKDAFNNINHYIGIINTNLLALAGEVKSPNLYNARTFLNRLSELLQLISKGQ